MMIKRRAAGRLMTEEEELVRAFRLFDIDGGAFPFSWGGGRRTRRREDSRHMPQTARSRRTSSAW